MVGIQLLIVYLFKTLDRLVLLDEVNEVICIRFKMDYVLPEPPNLLCLHILLRFY
jgi:hypothetical protein